MKQVVFEPINKNVININDINNNSIVGIKFNSLQDKVWVFNYGIEGYGGMRIGRINSQGLWFRESIKEYCREVGEQNADIFVFDSEDELKKWLME